MMMYSTGPMQTPTRAKAATYVIQLARPRLCRLLDVAGRRVVGLGRGAVIVAITSFLP
jgi:hypothetical protein